MLATGSRILAVPGHLTRITAHQEALRDPLEGSEAETGEEICPKSSGWDVQSLKKKEDRQSKVRLGPSL